MQVFLLYYSTWHINNCIIFYHPSSLLSCPPLLSSNSNHFAAAGANFISVFRFPYDYISSYLSLSALIQSSIRAISFWRSVLMLNLKMWTHLQVFFMTSKWKPILFFFCFFFFAFLLFSSFFWQGNLTLFQRYTQIRGRFFFQEYFLQHTWRSRSDDECQCQWIVWTKPSLPLIFFLICRLREWTLCHKARGLFFPSL